MYKRYKFNNFNLPMTLIVTDVNVSFNFIDDHITIFDTVNNYILVVSNIKNIVVVNDLARWANMKNIYLILFFV